MAIYVKSSTMKQDFSEFVKTHNPDLEEVLDWIDSHWEVKDTLLSYSKPEDIFDDDTLSRWAKDHDFVAEENCVKKKKVKRLLESIKSLYTFYHGDKEIIQDKIDKVLEIAGDIESNM